MMKLLSIRRLVASVLPIRVKTALVRAFRRERKPLTCRPELMCLEERTVPAVINVTSVAQLYGPSGAVSTANAHPGSTIVFAAGTTAAPAAYNLTDAGELLLNANTAVTTTAPNNPAATIITAFSGDRVFEIEETNATTPTSVSITGLTIQGGAVVGSNGGGILVDDAGDRLQLINSVVQNNSATNSEYGGGNGGGIYSAGLVELTNSTISSNQAIPTEEYGGGSGGGIYAAGVTLLNSSVLGNSADPADIDDGVGGGIYASSQMVSLTNSVVNGNVAGGSGGGIYASTDGAAIMLSGSTVDGNNSIDGAGGGIWAQSDVSLANHSDVSHNQALASGGGIFSQEGTVGVLDSTVTFNAGDLHDRHRDSEYGGGGGISAFGDVTVSGSSISNNTAGASGGGVFSAAGAVLITADANGVPSAVNNNTALDGDGGGVFAVDGVILSGASAKAPSTINTNQAQSGGGIFTYNDGVLLTNAQVNQNVATDGQGGGVDSQVGSVNATASQVNGNTARESGGGIWTDQGNVNLTAASQVNGNTSEYGGGGGIFVPQGNVNVSASTVNGNAAGGSGGGIFARFGTVTITAGSVNHNVAQNEYGGGIATEYGGANISAGSTVSFNTALESGGGIYAAQSGVTVDDSSINNNTTQSGAEFLPALGGGIFAKTGVTIADNSTVDGNTANDSGGAIFSAGTVYVFNSDVSHNQAASEGGGIAAAASVVISGSTVDGNNALGSGGGIFAPDGTVTLTNSHVDANQSAHGAGGGIFGGEGASFDNSTADGNTADGPGGGIAVGAGAVSLTDGSDVSHNRSQEASGGGIFAQPGAVSVTNSTVTYNTAADYGGGIFAALGSVTLNAGHVDHNQTLTESGGGIYTLHGDVALTNVSSADANTALGKGGGIFAGGGLTLALSDVSANQSTDSSGGGIYAAHGANIAASTIDNNSAADAGGGVFAFDGIIVNTSTIAGNKSTQETGGGIFAATGGVNITSSTISGNSAPNGAGIATSNFPDNAITLLATTVTGNTASFDGGGINAQGDALSITNSILSDNTALFGGGANVQGSPNTVITGSTFVGNQALRSGGALFITGDVPPSIINSTFGANSANVDGGAIYADDYAAVNLLDDTLNLNNASQGGGVYSSGGSTVSLEDTIVASSGGGNFAVNSGAFLSLGHNISSDNTAAGFFLTAASSGFANNGDFNNTNPKLGALAPNGGLMSGAPNSLTPIQTYAPTAGSLAIDNGDNNGPNVDERNVPRPKGTATDIGAVETTFSIARPPIFSQVIPVIGADDAARLASFLSAVTSASAGTEIILPAGTYQLTAPVVFNFNVTIVGAGAGTTIIEAPAGNRAFEFADSANAVHISGVTIENGAVLSTSANTNGGAILVDGAQTLLTLSGVSLQNNVAYGSGGAIYTPGTLVLINSLVGTIGANNAMTGSGGGIFAGGNTTLNGSTVSSNLAGAGGGGLFTNGILNLINSSVDDNNTAGNGGGIADGSADAPVTLTNSHADGNAAAFGLALDGDPIEYGGSGYHAGEILTVEGGTALVPAQLLVASVNEYGGITGVALYQGGIYAVAPGEPVSVTGEYGGSATFNLVSTTPGNGGGIFAESNVLLNNNSSTTGNAGFGSGGGIFSDLGNVALLNSAADGNTTLGNGGGIYAQSNVLVTGASIVNGNSASGSGAGIYAAFGNVSVTGLSATQLAAVSENSAANHGGGIRAGAGISLAFAQTTDDSAAQGGALWSQVNGVNLTNSIVTGNETSTQSGGGVWSEYGAVNLNNTTLDTNTAGIAINNANNSSPGGGIYSEFGPVSLSNSHADGNVAATGSGGGIFAEYGSVALADSSVNDNASDGSGGGIFTRFGNVSLNASDANSNNNVNNINTASFHLFDQGGGNPEYGGSGYTVGETLTVLGGDGAIAAQITVNSLGADNSIAAYTLSNVGSYTVAPVEPISVDPSGTGAGALFDLGQVPSNGGGIATEFGNVSLQAGSTASDNAAFSSGGGIYVQHGLVLLQASHADGNIATFGAGGGIFDQLGNVQIASGLVANRLQSSTVGAAAAANAANLSGGGIFAQSGGVLLLNSSVEANKITGALQVTGADTDDPGSGYSVGDVLTVQGGVFTMPAQITVEAVDDSGDITQWTVTTPGAYSVEPTGAAGVSGGTGAGATFLLDFAGGDGGGIASEYGGVLLLGTPATRGQPALPSIVAGNSATVSGGGIYTQNADVDANFAQVFSNIAANTFEGATLGTGGGIVIKQSGDANLANSIVEDNFAGLSTGGIDTQNGDVNLLNSTVEENVAVSFGGAAVIGDTGGIFADGVTLINSSVAGNFAQGAGAGIEVTQAGALLINSNVNDNTALGIYGVTGAGLEYGGSGYSLGDVLTVEGGTAGLPAQLTVTGVDEFGAITSVAITIAGSYSDASSISGDVSGGTGDGSAEFDITIAPTQGGGIDAQNGSVLLTGSAVNGNSVSGLTGASGGGIYTNDGSVIALKSTISGNTASNGSQTTQATEGEGGGVFATGGVILAGTSANNNAAGVSGGGIYAAGNNDSGVSGSVILTGNSAMTGNTASNAIAFTLKGNITKNSNLVTNINTANLFVGMTVSGPGIPAGTTITAIDPAASVNEIQLSNNASANANAATLTFTASATIGDGGAIYFGGFNGGVWVDHSTVNNNLAGLVGGAVSVGACGGGERGNVHISFSTLSNNQANQNFNTAVTPPSAGAEGGAVFTDGTQLTIVASTLNNNRAFEGGAVMMEDVDDFVIYSSTFANNAAGSGGGRGRFGNGDGGALQIDDSTGSITNSTIGQNSAGGSGGGIYSQDSVLNLLDDSFVQNRAAVNAGASISSFDGPTTLHDSIFSTTFASTAAGNLDGDGYISFGGNVVSALHPPTLPDPFFVQSLGDRAAGAAQIFNPLGGIPVLGNFGGPTQTFTLAATSPALDNGDGFGPAIDQRGVLRPQGPKFDSGAVEGTTGMAALHPFQANPSGVGSGGAGNLGEEPLF